MGRYKEDKDKKNALKLNKKLDECDTPEFIKNYLLKQKSESGKLTYWSCIKNILNWLIESNCITKNSISEITPEDFYALKKDVIVEYLQELVDKGQLPNSVNTQKNILASFWKYLVNEELIENNILQNIPRMQFRVVDNNRLKLPSTGDLQDMIKEINQKSNNCFRIRTLVIITILKETGLLLSELAELNIDDLHLSDMQPWMSIAKRDNEIETKIFYISKEVKNAFEEWIDIRNQLTSIIDNDALFLSNRGTRLSGVTIEKIFSKYSKNKITPQMLRNMYYSKVQARSKLTKEIINIPANNFNKEQYFSNKSEEVKIKKIEILTDGFEVLKSRIENTDTDLSEISEIIVKLFLLDKKLATEIWQYTLNKYCNYESWNRNATYHITSFILEKFIEIYDINDACQLLKDNSIIKRKLFKESYCISEIFLKELIEKNKLYELNDYYEQLLCNTSFLNYKSKNNLEQLVERITHQLIYISPEGIELLMQLIKNFSEDYKAIISVHLTSYM